MIELGPGMFVVRWLMILVGIASLLYAGYYGFKFSSYISELKSPIPIARYQSAISYFSFIVGFAGTCFTFALWCVMMGEHSAVSGIISLILIVGLYLCFSAAIGFVIDMAVHELVWNLLVMTIPNKRTLLYPANFVLQGKHIYYGILDMDTKTWKLAAGFSESYPRLSLYHDRDMNLYLVYCEDFGYPTQWVIAKASLEKVKALVLRPKDTDSTLAARNIFAESNEIFLITDKNAWASSSKKMEGNSLDEKMLPPDYLKVCVPKAPFEESFSVLLPNTENVPEGNDESIEEIRRDIIMHIGNNSLQ